MIKCLHKSPPVRVVAFCFNSQAHLVSCFFPFIQRGLATGFLSQLDSTIQSVPALDFGVYEMTGLTAQFPDATVRALPGPDDSIYHFNKKLPVVVVRGFAPVVPSVREIQQVTVSIQLTLSPSVVPHAYGLGATIPFQSCYFVFREPAFPPKTENYLELVGAPLRSFQ